MSPLLLAILLLIAGIGLVLAELVLPGGVLGVLGIMALVGSVVAAFFFHRAAGAGAAVAILVLGPIAGGYWAKHLHRLPGGRRLVLGQVRTDNTSPLPRVSVAPGQVGIVANELRPSGTCEFDGERVEAVSEGSVIPAGARVRVVAFAEGRATVRAV